MTAEVLSLPRGGAGVRAPLVPEKAVLKDAPDFRFPISLLDSEWYHSCSREEALAGINLQARAIHQDRAGSLPDSDAQLARLADFGRDVESWKVARAKALEGWILCSDGRLYHPEVARNVLHIWIGRLEKRRASAFGNKSKGGRAGEDYGFADIQDDIDEALDALRAIDPQDKGLRDAVKRREKWRQQGMDQTDRRVLNMDGSERPDDDAAPIRPPNRPPIRRPLGGGPKVSEAKLSEAESDSEMPDRRSGLNVIPPGREAEEEQGPPPQSEDVRSTYPPEAFALWYNRYPLKEARLKAEAAFRQVQEAGLAAFPELMEGLERYMRDKPRSHDWCYPAVWLNNRRWTDGRPIPVATASGAAPPTRERVFVAVGTRAWEAWQAEARARGKPGWPSGMVRDGKTGWEFDSAWPPGHEPTGHDGEPTGAG